MSQDSSTPDYSSCLESFSSPEPPADSPRPTCTVDPNSGSEGADYEYQFLEEPSQELKCGLCLSVLRDPHLTSCCGHHFCETCIKPIRDQAKYQCPLCQEEGFSTMLNKSLCRVVGNLRVYCSNSSKGCKWSGELKCIEDHFGKECDFVPINCTNCNAPVLRINLESHLTKCPKRPFACEACGVVDAWQTITQIHHAKCPSWQIPCPNNCNEEIMRKNTKTHLTVCPLQRVSCEFEFAGCTEQIYRKDITAHMSENIAQHLSLMATTFKSELAKRDKKIDSLEKLVGNLKIRGSFPVVLYMPGFKSYEPKDCWFSDSFYSHPNGYKLCLSVYPNGTGKGTGTHLSVFGHVMAGENDDTLFWPFQGMIHVSLVVGKHKTFKKKLTIATKLKRVTTGSINKFGQGLPQFVRLGEVAECTGLKFIVECVEVY